MRLRIGFLWPAKCLPQDMNTGGSEAKEKAEVELARVKAETAYYKRLGNELRDIRGRNHFAESIRATMRRA